MKKGTITINNLAGGWINDFNKGSYSSPQTKPNTYYLGLANFNKPSFLGQVSNSFKENPTLMGATTLPINATIGSNNYVYSILANGLIKAFDASTTWNSSSVDYTAPAGCNTDAYKDIWKHVSPTGVEVVMFTYQAGGTAYIGYANVGAIATRNDTYGTLSTANVPHVGCVSVANQSFITDGQYLQRYDPNSATPLASRVNMGSGWTLVSVADYGNYVACVGNNGTTSRMWLCNSTDTLPTFQYDIRDSNVTAIVNEGGVLRVFTTGKNGTTKIKSFDGNGFSEEADWECPTSLCASPTHAMVDVWLNQVVWRTPDGYIWTYGSVRKNEIPSGAHRVALLTTNTTSLGFVKNLYQNQLYIGITNASNSYIYQVKADESYTSTSSSNIRTALYETPRNATIEKIIVYFSDYTQSSPSLTASSFQMSFYKDYTTSPDLLLGEGTIPQSATGGEKLYYWPFRTAISNLSSFYLDITFSACTWRKITIQYTFEDGDL